MDTPGHTNFSDEVCAAMRLSDGALLVVDAVEGVMVGTERAVRAAAAEGLSLCLVVTKLDRLIVELKLPPADAYFKLKHTIEEVGPLAGACDVRPPGGLRRALCALRCTLGTRRHAA